MRTLFTGAGFLGTTAPFQSDLSLIFIVISAVLFTIGWRLAVAKKFEIHRWVQTSAATVNAIAVAVVMIPSFIIHILPGIPSKLSQGDYGFTTLHAVIGATALLLGVFVVLRANGLVPRALRFRNYKLFMRTSYILYMAATVLGVILYALVYIYHI